jgi:hypothetical protein
MVTQARLSHDELQKIEHGTKILQEHLAATQVVVNETEALLDTYVPLLRQYLTDITAVRAALGSEVVNILRSVGDLKALTGKTQEIIQFCQAVERLDALLTPERAERLRRILGPDVRV